MAIPLGSIVSIAMALISNRDKIVEIIQEATSLWAKVRAIIEKSAPDLIPGTAPLPIDVQPDAGGFSMEWVQESLNKLQDAGLEVDGDYGPATAQAIKEFQTEYGITPDGWAGPVTTAKLLELLQA